MEFQKHTFLVHKCEAQTLLFNDIIYKKFKSISFYLNKCSICTENSLDKIFRVVTNTLIPFGSKIKSYSNSLTVDQKIIFISKYIKTIPIELIDIDEQSDDVIILCLKMTIKNLLSKNLDDKNFKNFHKKI